MFDLDSRLRIGGRVGSFEVGLAANWTLDVVDVAGGPVASVGLFAAAVLAVG